MSRIVVLLTCAGLAACGDDGPRPPAASAGRAGASLPADAGTDPGSERAAPGPHPQFPTPRTAGSEDLFFVDDPDRGPRVEPMTVPSRGLVWTRHRHCELDRAGLACGPAVDDDDARWQRGEGESATVVRRTTAPTRTFVVERNADGATTRLARLDAAGRVAWARAYDPPGLEYTARRANGANALPGCGRIRLEPSVDRATCLQWLGAPMHDHDGVVTIAYERDATGLPVGHRYLDADGTPTTTHDRIHRRTVDRDEAGRPVAVRRFDAEGAPVRGMETGCHGEDLIYDGAGRLALRRCVGADGAPAHFWDGHAAVLYARDRRGCRVGELYLDVRGLPAENRHGALGWWRRARGEACTTAEEWCVDARGRRTPCRAGEPAAIEYRFDARGRVQRARHLRADGSPGRDASYGVFELRYRYDDAGNPIDERCFAPEGQPTECGATGFHRLAQEFDDAGRVTRATFYDTAGEPTTNLGVTARTFRHDAYDHLVETDNELGSLALPTALERREFLYDRGHRLHGIVLYDQRDRPARYTGCFAGATCPAQPWHAVRVVRSDHGQVLRNLFFDHERRLIRAIDCRTEPCFQ